MIVSLIKKLNNSNILLIFLFWRLFLFLPLFFSEHFLKFRKGFEYVSSLSYINSQNPVNHFLWNPWANFDAIHYLSIATYGYTLYNAVFFPLFPLIIRVLAFPLGVTKILEPGQFFIALTLVSIFFFLSLIFLYRLVRFDFKKNIGIQTILLILVFPTSFFFATIYSESLFFLLLILSFYCARKKNWVLTGVFSAFLATSRFVGIAIFPALVYEFWKSEKTIFKKSFISVLLGPLGLISYAWFNFFMWKNPLHFVQAQEWFANNRSTHAIVLLPQTLFRYFKILSTLPVSQYEWWIALLEFTIFIFVCVMFFIAWRKKVRESYLIFAFIAFLIPTLTGTFIGLPRYVIPLFPVFIALALIKNKFAKIAYFVTGIVLLIILFALFSKGYFIA